MPSGQNSTGLPVRSATVGKSRALARARWSRDQVVFPVAVTLVLLLALVFPVLAAMIVIIGLAAVSRRPVAAGLVVVALLSTLFATVNAGKAIANDWVWYVEHYRALEYTPLGSYLGVGYLGVTAEPTEPLYYTLASVISQLTGANVAVLAVVITVLIYGTIGCACVAAARSAASSAWTIMVATAAGMVVGLTFTLSTQLVRQEIAAGLIAAAIVASGYRRWLLSLVLALSAIFTHNSALVPAAGLAVALLFQGREKGRFVQFAVSGLLFFAMGRLYLIFAGNDAYTGQNNGSISTAVIVLDVAILATFLYMRRRSFASNSVATVILLCVPAFYGFVLGVASQPLPLLRMYFFIEVLRALMIVFISAHLLQSRWRVVNGVLLLVAAFAYLGLRLAQSPFTYSWSFIDIVTWSPLIS